MLDSIKYSSETEQVAFFKNILEQLQKGVCTAAALNPSQLSQESLSFSRPPNSKMGDIAFVCFPLAKILKQAPEKIAQQIAENFPMSAVEYLESVRTDGGYVNFKFARNAFAQSLLGEILDQKKVFGASDMRQGDRVMMEYVSPNTNKPLHLGHVRNALIGWSVAALIRELGATVVKSDIINDRGIHIMKSMLAYQRWGNEETPSASIKGDKLVGRYYVLFEIKYREEQQQWFKDKGINYDLVDDKTKDEIEKQFMKESQLLSEAQNMLRQWEAGNSEVRTLWEKMNCWVFTGFEETYRNLDVDFDQHYYESQIYTGGKEMILEGLARGVFYKADNGAIMAPLTRVDSKKFPTDKALLRADGTGLYITQDINLADVKFREHKLTHSIYCIGSEQDLYMQQVFAVCKLLGFVQAENMFHLSYGMVYLPEGKMKSREGTVVDADELIQQLTTLAEQAIHERYEQGTFDDAEVIRRSKIIALAALKFYILLVCRTSPIHFNPKESLSFEGKTGPYVQYAYARMASIRRKAGNASETSSLKDLNITEECEWQLLMRMLEYPAAIVRSAENLDPSFLANFLIGLAHTANMLYHQLPVLKANEPARTTRLRLIQACQMILRNGLNLLGIEVLEEM